MPKLLVIDDVPNTRLNMEQAFAGSDVRILSAATSEQGLSLAAAESPDVILLDVEACHRSGLEVFRDLRRIDPTSLVVIATERGARETAVEAIRLGAYDCLVKPLEVGQIQRIVGQACETARMMQSSAPTATEERSESESDRLIGCGPAMQTVYKQIVRVAPQDINVLIVGESGTGKELLAREIHRHSRRREAPFLAVRGAAIPEAILECEHSVEENAGFAEVRQRRADAIGLCYGGTLFLDEVADMSLHAQAAILRLLQEETWGRVGEYTVRSAGVRILAATNRNLESLVEQGRFRQDLLYRLRGVTISLPPLRDRREDIPELAHYYLHRFSRRLGTSVQAISPDALAVLQQYSWPGNVRELQSVIRESLIVSAGPCLVPEFLRAVQPPNAGSPGTELEHAASRQSQADGPSLREFVEDLIIGGGCDVYRRARIEFDRLVIVRAMQQVDGNQYRAAEILGISRATLRARLRAMRMETKKVVAPQNADASRPTSARVANGVHERPSKVHSHLPPDGNRQGTS